MISFGQNSSAQKIFESNILFINNYPYMSAFNYDNIKNVKVKEQSQFYEVVFDEERVIKIWKNGEFDYKKLFNTKEFQIDNLMNINVFETLRQIVRSSEMCGIENRIRIFYDSVEKFIALACVMKFEEIFDRKQFIICFHREECAPVLKNTCEMKHLDIEELDTLIFFYQPQSSGYTFFRDVIQESSYIVYADGWRMHRYLERMEEALGIRGMVKEIFWNTDSCFSGIDFVKEILGYPVLLGNIGVDVAGILKIFLELFAERSMDAAGIMKALFISKYYYDRKDHVDNRIVPIVIYFPDHYERFMEYYSNLKKGFRKVLYFRTMRNPVIRTIRGYEFNKKNGFWGFNKIVDFLVDEIYFHRNLPLLGETYVIKFEDLKKNPEYYLKKVCNCFRIPYENELIQREELFGNEALKPDLDKIFSEDDIRMLEFIYKDILLFYKYSESVDGTMEELQRYTFQFEKEFADLYGLDEKFVHMAVQRAIGKALLDKGNGPFPVWLN